MPVMDPNGMPVPEVPMVQPDLMPMTMWNPPLPMATDTDGSQGGPMIQNVPPQRKKKR
jgi:hypothetical protein